MERVFGSTNFCYFKPKQFNGKVYIGGRINAAGPTGTKITYANVKAICQKHHVDFENILQLQEAVNACRKVDSSVSLSGSSNCTSGNSGFSPSLAKPQPTIASKPLPIASKPPIIAPVFRAPSSAYSAAKSTTSKNSLFHALIFAYQLAGGIPTPMSALEPAIDPKFWKANGHSEFISYLVSAEEAGVVSLSHEHSDIIVSLPNQKESSHSAIPAPVQNRIFSEREVDEESDLYDEVPKMLWADDV
ncbi:hypothetical protein BDR26DRAFT_854704 [Obelidium mucronatum]|nr:hypothetical protein BDR26DRAFT_854704 [Obelidium mucronatum]